MAALMRGGCWPGMPARDTNDRPGCRRDCLHRVMVEEYRQAKADSDRARYLQREYDTVGHATEQAEWDATHPPALTFQQYLLDRRRPAEGSDHGALQPTAALQ